MLLTAIDGKGVYYAGRTLCQFLETSAKQRNVDVPLAEITDWPGSGRERGLWNFPEPASWVPWMASLKLNYGKMSNTQFKKPSSAARRTAW